MFAIFAMIALVISFVHVARTIFLCVKKSDEIELTVKDFVIFQLSCAALTLSILFFFAVL